MTIVMLYVIYSVLRQDHSEIWLSKYNLFIVMPESFDKYNQFITHINDKIYISFLINRSGSVRI